jgi:hypothetical protein
MNPPLFELEAWLVIAPTVWAVYLLVASAPARRARRRARRTTSHQ